MKEGTICLKNFIFNVELNSASEISQKSTTFRAIEVLSENYHPSKIGGLEMKWKTNKIILVLLFQKLLHINLNSWLDHFIQHKPGISEELFIQGQKEAHYGSSCR